MEVGNRSWDELDVLGMGTIYEEDEDLSSSNLNTPEFSISSTPTKNSRLMGRDQEVNIYVQDSYFRLHKKPLIARSEYLRRHLNDVSEITLAPPLNLTAQTFSLVADFCYGAALAITPFNVAALRTAAEILGMTAISVSDDENLLQKTERYLRRVVDVNGECASIVLESCFPLLPEAETAAALVSRCVETWSITIGGEGGDLSCLDGFKCVTFEELDLILSALSRRLSQSHDILYTIIDVHLKENIAKVNEDRKTQLCNYIDCSILSPRVLMHAVNNARMPLRFVLQAMFMEQLNTRNYIIPEPQIKKHGGKEDPVTLGSILQHEAALRQVADLKAAMNATNSRIQFLEKELSTMRKLLSVSESNRSRIDSSRSASFRLHSDGRKIERNQKGSISSINLREMKTKPPAWTDESSTEKEKKSGKGGFIKGLMIALRLQKKNNDRMSIENDEVKITKSNDFASALNIDKRLHDGASTGSKRGKGDRRRTGNLSFS